MKRSLLLAVLTTAALAAPAAAQTATPVRSNTSGVLLGIGLNASTINANDVAVSDGTQRGGGLFLQLGYGFGPHFALYTELAGTGISNTGNATYTGSRVGLGHFDLGARYHFGGDRSRFRPFLLAAVGGRAVTHDNVDYVDANGDSQTGVLTYSGASLTLGLGADYFFSPSVALHSSVQASGGKFTTQTVGDMSERNLDIQSTSGRLNVGIDWFPSRHR